MKLTKRQEVFLRWGHDLDAKKRGGWVQLVIFLVLFILAELLRPKPKLDDALPASLGDFQFPTATEGRSVPLLWGTCRVKGPNIVWYGDLYQQARTENVQASMFSTKTVVIGYAYHIGVQAAICRGPGAVLQKFWIGDKEIFSGTVTNNTTFEISEPLFFGGNTLGNGGFGGTFRFFSGELDQPVSSYLNQFQVEGTKTPAYRGTCYLAPDEEYIYVGNSSSIKPWSFEIVRIPDGLALGANATVNGADANPMNVIYEIMTDLDWGLGYDVTEIDIPNFTTAANTLFTEGNGFSLIQDTAKEAIDILKMLEAQVDGILFMDQLTRKWKIKLARFDYVVLDIPEINSSNIREIKNFSRASWEDTTNQVRVEFTDRGDEYKTTFALALDMANQRLQNNVNIVAQRKFPGVKDKTLANQLAWRSLRVMSYPLAKAKIVVDRSFYDVTPGQVLAFTDADLNFTRLPMRVMKVDMGQLVDNMITLELVQDIFSFELGLFSDPLDTGWTPPSDTLQPFLSTQQIAFEAPRAFVIRDTLFTTEMDKIWCGARIVGPEVSFKIIERHATNPTAPTGTYLEVGEAFAFMKIGELNTVLNVGSAYPLTSLVLTSSPDSQTSLLETFITSTDLVSIGTNLLNIILVGDEFMLCESAQASALNVQLDNVWRGALDSVQSEHAAGTDVYVLFAGGGLADATFAPGQNVDIKMLPHSVSDDVTEVSATLIAIAPMDNRLIRPYPPSSLRLANTIWATTTTLEDNGTDGEDYAIDALLRRRDFRTTDELAVLDVDAVDLFPDYPTVNSTDHQIDVRNDPDGANTLLFTETFTTAQHDILRIDILKITDGILPTRMRFVMRSRHDVLSVTYGSRQELTWDFDITTALTGQFNFTALDKDDISHVYTSTETGQYDFTLSSSFAVGDVEYRIDGVGSWLQLIAAASTTGNIASVISGETIEIRHLSTDTTVTKQIDMDAPGAGQDGYAILFT